MKKIPLDLKTWKEVLTRDERWKQLMERALNAVLDAQMAEHIPV